MYSNRLYCIEWHSEGYFGTEVCFPLMWSKVAYHFSNLSGDLRCIWRSVQKTPIFRDTSLLFECHYICNNLFGCTTPKYISFMNALTFKEDYAFCFMKTSPMTFNYWIDIDFLNLLICNSVKGQVKTCHYFWSVFWI